jgi:antitoxin component of MazEF toxin-antitoxin module
MIFERTVTAVGGGTGFTLPGDLLKYLNLEKGDLITVEDKNDDGESYLIIKKKGDVYDSSTVKE